MWDLKVVTMKVNLLLECSSLQDGTYEKLFYPEDGGSRFFRNSGKYQSQYKVSHPRRPSYFVKKLDAHPHNWKEIQ